jgi:hypothetical protein
MNLRRPRPLVSNLHHSFSLKSQWRNAGHRHVRSALNIRPSPQNFEGPFHAIAEVAASLDHLVGAGEQ